MGFNSAFEGLIFKFRNVSAAILITNFNFALNTQMKRHQEAKFKLIRIK